MKIDVMIGRLVVDGTHRAEIGNFLIEVATECLYPDSQIAPFIGNCYHVPIQRSPVEIARNHLLEQSLDKNCTYLFMVDDDHAIEPGFFRAAMQHLMSNEPCAIGTPARTAGPPTIWFACSRIGESRST